MLPCRIGLGEDTHRTTPGGPLRLGGIDVPHDQQMVGHSDADVLLHAITDALLGAAGCGDIGELFPNTDEANRNRDSGEMLQTAARHVTSAGYQILNLDCVVSAERPRLSNHRKSIRERIAQLLEIKPSQVFVKGKTGEGVGPVGREEAISARCVILLAEAQNE
ncbi:MAG: 2-C-methyl-D-erythritol 2,4-cyclodiphosphate synthase [Pirellulales bacterium]